MITILILLMIIIGIIIYSFLICLTKSIANKILDESEWDITSVAVFWPVTLWGLLGILLFKAIKRD